MPRLCRGMVIGVHAFDALHVASAAAGKADVFVTTDDRLLKRIGQTIGLKALLPGEALAQLENSHEH